MKAIGIATVGITGIGLVLFTLSVMCLLVVLFASQVLPQGPAVTISPMERPVTLPTLRPAGNVIFDEIRAIPDGHYQFYSLAMKPGIAINVSISTGDAPVDVMVTDSANYSKYITAVNSLDGGEWGDYAGENFVVQKSFRFTAPGTGRYYVIVDNTRYPESGAEAGKSVNVHTIITGVP